MDSAVATDMNIYDVHNLCVARTLLFPSLFLCYTQLCAVGHACEIFLGGTLRPRRGTAPAHPDTHLHMLDRGRLGCLVSFLLRNVFSGILESSRSVIVEQGFKIDVGIWRQLSCNCNTRD